MHSLILACEAIRWSSLQLKLNLSTHFELALHTKLTITTVVLASQAPPTRLVTAVRKSLCSHRCNAPRGNVSFWVGHF